MKKSVALGLLVFLFAFNALHIVAFAEEIAPIHQTTSPITVEPPIVTLSDPKLKPITLSELNIETHIIANIATSTYELVFHNPNPQVLEGELLFSLLDGQQVIDYALPINGVYRHASVVPKAKGKEAYESTIRAQIDPALLEKTIGNNFKTRLYPLPANGHKKVKITLQELLQNKQNTLQYRIPFITQHALDSLKLTLNIPALNSQPSANIADIQFDTLSQGKSIKLEKSNFKISKPILITLDNTTAPSDTFVQQQDNETFLFSSSDFPQPAQQAPRALPRKIALIWDTSFSNQQRQIDKELSFLAAYIEQVKTASIELVFFNHQQATKQSLTLCAPSIRCESSGQPFSTLSELLKNSHYNGSNNFSSIDISQLQADEVLLFSNGIKTLFDDELQNINKPITTINASTKANTALLKHYATRSNGRFIDLMQYTPQEAMQQFSATLSHIKVAASSANIVTDSVFVSQHTHRLHLIAKAKQAFDSKQATWVTLDITTQNKTQQKTLQLTNPIRVKHSLDSLWATKKIAALNANYKQNKAAIIALAKRYKVLTKDTSLIVLDRVEDYVRYDIEPPKTLKEDYVALQKKKTDKKLYEKEQALIESIQLLQEQNVWYKTTFSKTKPKPQPEKKKREGIEAEVEADFANIQVGSANTSPIPSRPRPAPVEANRVTAAATPAPVLMLLKAKESPHKPQPKKIASAEIKLKAFDPKAAYLDAIKATDKSQWQSTYYAQQAIYRTQPMFYVDVASLFYKNAMPQQGVIILSNILELDFENSEFLRVFALKAMELGEYKLAIKAFEKVKELRPFEPQAFRDLALAQVKNKTYQQAADNLYHILTHTWDGRFSGIKIVVINELNALLAQHKTIKRDQFDPRLINKSAVDLRIVINWSSDNTDIDLWVIDPYGEKTFYSNKVSRIGGKISNDITQGYGPEEFMIKEAVAGTYKIQANYYGNSQQKQAIPVTIRAEIYSNFSKTNQIQKELVLRLDNKQAVIDIGEFKYDSD